MSTVSIVIPSFNGGEKLNATLGALLQSDTTALDAVEIIIVDDGSPIPVESTLPAFHITPLFSLVCVRQPNRGPAAARNTGFNRASGDMVLFLDDDILCPPQLIRQHVNAHAAHPSAVIYGRSPFVSPASASPLFRFINALGHDDTTQPEFVRVPRSPAGSCPSSATCSPTRGGCIGQDLETPAAEEFELAQRLMERSIPIWMANQIVAQHNYRVTLDNLCRQSYKHGIGCAEAAVKCPGTLALPAFQNLIAVNRAAQRGDSLALLAKKAFKRPWLGVGARGALVQFIKHVERLNLPDRVLGPVYRFVLGVHLAAGVREGFVRYTPSSPRRAQMVYS